MTTKASDVLDLSRARDLLGCAPGQSLLDGVRALVAERDAALQAREPDKLWAKYLEQALVERDHAEREARMARELLVEEQKLRHEYGTRLARLEAEAQRPPSVVAVSDALTFVVVDTEGGGTWVP